MDKKSVDKEYINPVDRFIHEFNSTQPMSESQLKEVQKHQRIAELRDDASAINSEE